MRTTSRVLAATASLALSALTLTACGSDSDSSKAAESTTSAAATGSVDLAAAGCPSTVVVQTDWNPEADHGHLYQLLGPNPKIDADKKSVTGDLYAAGAPTGVKIEIRAGGPAIGYQNVSSQMYQDKSITLGYVTTDEAIQFSKTMPTTGVFAENDKSAMMLMWDPATYPDVTSIADLGPALEKDKSVVRYFNGAAYMEYLVGAGIIPKSVTDGSYDGTPSKFVTDKGKAAQQGFATAEPYIYEHEVKAWGKPVKFAQIADTAWSPYPETMAVRTGDVSSLSGCLKALVPVMQQADVDYFKDPSTTNKLIVELVDKYNNGWTYSEDVANYAVKTMKDLKIATDGDNGYVGDQDEARITKLMEVAVPIYTKSKDSSVKDGLKATDLFTNEFLDTKIGFGF
ncbi:ABC transporter substrate-binding protein [Nocardioides sp.]|uniref:ABC transporter substrate-binding protein n=1 Tax=Nocardioides sp. TaxID=35761 RepID=UPI00260D4AF1|nr:ABC transporter substrate-binding protein [Nocardioides sp.]